MRLTTKIIIGFILSIFLLSLLHIIGYSFTDRKNYDWYQNRSIVKIPQTNKTGINIESYRVIVFDTERTESVFYRNFSNEENGLFIYPATTADAANKLFIPEALDDCITTQSKNDTLTIKINMDNVQDKYAIKDEEFKKSQLPGRSYGVQISGFNLFLHTSNVDVINRLNNIQTQIRNMEAESIKIYSFGDILIDSCKTNGMKPNSNRKLTVTNSVAQSIHLDLDRVSNWNIADDCVIDVFSFTGSRQNNNIPLRSDYNGKIVWLPKRNEAELNLRIKGDSAQISFQTQSMRH